MRHERRHLELDLLDVEGELGAGLALAPRLGANFLVGRSGVLTPSISYEYTSQDAMTTNDNITVVAVSSSVRFNVGYTAMW